MVDADALIKAMGVHTYMQTEWTPTTAWGVPIVDAEPVVRCKDCKHHDPEDRKCDCGALERAGCVFPVADDYFCSWGERREDGKID